MQKATKNNRVLVIGAGMVTPLGATLEQSWNNLLAGKSGIQSLEGLDEFKGLKCQIGGFLHQDYKNLFEKNYETSFGPKARVYTLANCITS